MASTSDGTATRQTFNLVIGCFGVAIGAVMIVTGLVGRNGTSLALWGVVVAAVAFCVLVRPSIRFGSNEVTISNVLREVRIPWSGISHATSRGSLTVHDVAGAKTTVWAIGSQKPRAQHGDDVGMVNPMNWRPDPGSLTVSSTSAQALREGIDAVAIDNPPAKSSGRTVRWLPIPCALMLAAVVCAATTLIV